MLYMRKQKLNFCPTPAKHRLHVSGPIILCPMPQHNASINVSKRLAASTQYKPNKTCRSVHTNWTQLFYIWIVNLTIITCVWKYAKNINKGVCVTMRNCCDSLPQLWRKGRKWNMSMVRELDWLNLQEKWDTHTKKANTITPTHTRKSAI